MLAARLYGAGDLRLEDIPVPDINDDEILIQVKRAALCGTDIRMYQNGAAAVSPGHPLILGHEFSGDIAAVGKRVEGWQVGQRVFLAPNIGCGHCAACISGDSHLCEDLMAMGVTIDGAFAEYLRLPAQALAHGNLSVLGDDVSYEDAAINEALSCVYNGFLQYGVHVGDAVMVIGAGPIGVMHAKLARLAGASRVMLNDISAERLRLAAEVDPAFIPVPTEGIHERVLRETKGRGLDVCVTACPVPAVQALALELMGFGGRVNFFGGLPKKSEIVPLNTNIIHYKQLMVSGSTKANTAMVRKTMELIDSGALSVKEVITSRYPLEEIHAAIEFVAAGGGLKTIIEIS